MLPPELVLNRRLVGATVRLHNVETTAQVDDAFKALALSVKASVWQDPSRSHHREWRVIENVRHESWRHHLVASLPRGSWRRRFLCRLWDIALNYGGLQTTHIIDVDVPAVLPEVQKVYPAEVGRVVFPIQITEWGSPTPQPVEEPAVPGGYWVEAQ